MKSPSEIKSLFLLNKNITFLNFGSFGACPKPVMDEYIRWIYKLEDEPVQFMIDTGPRQIAESRNALGNYIGCEGNDLVYTMNPSYAINIIAKSLKLKVGDEVLTTNLEYGAMDVTWNYYCKKNGAIYIRQPVPLPIKSKEEWLDEFWKGYTKKTKVVFISHITSSTGLILPVADVCRRAKELGLIAIVDGAHVPGHIPLNLTTLKADIYTGACHKWMMTPKGCSFLYVKRELQDLFDPLVISWGYNSANPSSSRFQDYHQMQGTRDFSAFLTVPASIQFMKKHLWPEVGAQCRLLVKEYGPQLSNLLQTVPLAPLTDEYYGQLYSAQIHTKEPEKVQALLYDKHQIEIPVMRHDEKCFIRFSVQGFNSKEDIEKLLEAIQEIKKTIKM